MGARLVSIIPKTSFTFNAATGAGQTVQILAKTVSVLDWTSGVLLVRTFSRTLGTGAIAEIAVRNTFPAADDPSNDYLQLPSSSSVASVIVDSNANSAPPSLQTCAFSGVIGPYVMVGLVWTPLSGTSTFAISVDLLGRSGC